MQSKIPFAPPDWTVARGARYVTKLGVFALVPGLHQIICNRRIFGGLLLALYFSADFVFSNLPYDLSKDNYAIHNLAEFLSGSAQHISWILLLLDIKNLESKLLKPGLFLVLACVAGIYLLPHHSPGNLDLLIEDKNDLCPVFCMNDIVEYDHKDYRTDKISAGDYVLMDRPSQHPYITKILAVPSKELCDENRRSPKYLPVNELMCLGDLDGTKYFYPHLILGGPNPQLERIDGKKVSKVSDGNVHGVRLRKIGNVKEYFILTDEITDFVGHALLTAYKLTGVNLFGLSGKFR